jgi:beta-mannosidase
MKMNVTIVTNTGKNVFTVDTDKLLKGQDRKEVIIHPHLADNNGGVYTNNYFLLQQKNITFPKVAISGKVAKIEDRYEVILTSDKFARAVFMSINGIDNFFESNYFDILSQQNASVKVRMSLSRSDFEKQLKIVSLSDTYLDRLQ